MPSNQQQITEQAKFTYSPLGKAFEKQTKTIESQGKKKQIDALKSLESLKPKEVKSEETKPIDYDDYYINRMAEIRDQSKKYNFNNLTYIFKGKTAPTNHGTIIPTGITCKKTSCYILRDAACRWFIVKKAKIF